jgi:hypothetical protein
MINKSQIVSENKKRLELLHGDYQPLIGKGSPLDRFPFQIDNDRELWLPQSMMKHPLIMAAHNYETLFDFLKYSYRHTMPSERASGIKSQINTFHVTRLSYDFEFWAASCARIQDDEGEHVPFILNPPQRILFHVLEAMRLAGVPMRVILLKARQWGGSTFLRLYMTWIQLFIRTGWGAAIVATVEPQAMHIRGMINIIAMYHPEEIFKIALRPYRGSQKNREIVGRNCVVGVGSYEEPDNLRSFTFQMLHLSECAMWTQTAGKKPESVVQALRSTVPKKADTLICLESTANGVGNFFHREWQQAEGGHSDYKSVFIPWFGIPKYSMAIDKKDYGQFIESMTDADWDRWDAGATLEGILWYKSFMKGENYSQEAMDAEYPTTANGAFVTSGQRVFPHTHVRRIRETCTAPKFIGELHGREVTGPGAKDAIMFHENPLGNLRVWTKPADEVLVSNRYVIFVDIGGRSKKSDKSVMRVLDRYNVTEGGKPEFVATWRGNIDHDILAWKAVQLAIWYHNALLIVEDNSLDKEDDGRGNFYTILDEIAEHYENLYTRTEPDKVKEGVPLKYGFQTNRYSKPMIINSLLAAAREQLYIERDEIACNEMDTYEQKANKTLGAQDGCFDDMVISTAGCIWASSSYMDIPALIKAFEPTRRKTIIGEATI